MYTFDLHLEYTKRSNPVIVTGYMKNTNNVDLYLCKRGTPFEGGMGGGLQFENSEGIAKYVGKKAKRQAAEFSKVPWILFKAGESKEFTYNPNGRWKLHGGGGEVTVTSRRNMVNVTTSVEFVNGAIQGITQANLNVTTNSK